MSYSFDNENRLSVVSPGGATETVFGYDQSNQRVYQGTYNPGTGAYSNEQLYFYGADGKKLVAYSLQNANGSVTIAATQTNAWFGGRLLTPEDRLQSIGKYFPYGEDRYNLSPANPGNDGEKFATYTRDAATGLDYAYQRYYSSQIGRFLTVDPYALSGKPNRPQSWNRYSYVQADPVNYNDPDGLFLSVLDACSYISCIPPGAIIYSFRPQSVEHVTPADARLDQWNALSEDCQQALRTAMPVSPPLANTDYAIKQWLSALNTANTNGGAMQKATAGTNVPWSWVAAIGIRETGFGTQSGTKNIFQVLPSSLAANAANNISVAAQWVAGTLNHNVSVLSRAGISGNQLLVHLFASYNRGLSAVMNHPGNPDATIPTANKNYGSNTAQLTKCF